MDFAESIVIIGAGLVIESGKLPTDPVVVDVADLPHIKNILSPSSPLPSSPQDVRAQEPVPMPLP